MGELIRPARPDDLPAILEIMRVSLGWPADARAETLWRWKHEQNPFGASPVWVGETDGAVVAVRTFMRWELLRADGSILRAVRAVDTATHPSQQGKGWFRRLTLHGLDRLAAEGVGIVFNTPNDQSRPGYLKMGWEEQGRQAAWVRVLRPSALTRLWRSRVPADLWPEPFVAGLPPLEALARPGVGELLAATAARDTIQAGAVTTNRSVEFYRWRYGLPELGYRVVSPEAGPEHGFAVVRRRRRGASHELALLDVVAEAPRVVRRVALHGGHCDHAVVLGERPDRSWIQVPGLGPRLVSRTVDGTAVPSRFLLGLGDVELL